MVARPYAEVYRDCWTNWCCTIRIWNPRAVVVVIDHGNAVTVTEYHVDDGGREQFEEEDGFEWIRSLL